MKKAPNTRQRLAREQAANARAIEREARVDALRDGRRQRSVTMDPNRRAEGRRRGARGRTCRGEW